MTKKVMLIFQNRMYQKLTAPYDQRFKEPLWFPDTSVSHLMELGEKYIDRSLRGEALLCIAEVLAFQEEGMDGAITLMPFKCMPGTIVEGIMNSFEKDHSFYPILNLSYDGTAQANRMNKVRTFVYQVKRYAAAQKKNRTVKTHS